MTARLRGAETRWALSTFVTSAVVLAAAAVLGAGCSSDGNTMGPFVTCPGAGFVGPGGVSIDWCSACCAGPVYYPTANGTWAVCSYGAWECSTSNPETAGFTEWDGSPGTEHVSSSPDATPTDAPPDVSPGDAHEGAGG